MHPPEEGDGIAGNGGKEALGRSCGINSDSRGFTRRRFVLSQKARPRNPYVGTGVYSHELTAKRQNDDRSVVVTNVGLHPCVPPEIPAIAPNHEHSSDALNTSTAFTANRTFTETTPLAPGIPITYARNPHAPDKPNWFLRHYGSWRPKAVTFVTEE
ncbi:hypothetical protein KIH77_05495 [Bifidobacterium sp. 82T24]|uniref:hypothetical protein n=1 Tax=Bifidobacterium pluvialisilvae TaxID=2834436 RepID=UPI001C57F453|nr:hypothetical protein [Bifidobacterium pluvialisilvae]MBW3088184.1 hypothetical protein [Bifidobacterium pluvialisilvae]